MNRKKRLEKGIKSIEEEIKIHKEKQEKAREDGKIELEDYYGREILGLEKSKEKKKKIIEK